MTTTDQAIVELDIHFGQIDDLMPEIQSYLPFKVVNFENKEIVKTIDSFIFRFSKIQDTMGGKFFPATLDKLADYKDNMSSLDVLHKLEKLELLETNKWIDCQDLRNDLVHEYPDNQEKVAKAIDDAMVVYADIKTIYHKIKERIC